MLKPALLALISLPFLTSAHAPKHTTAHSPRPTATYTVKEGDTLQSISEKRFGTPAYADEIAYQNRLGIGNTVHAGQTLDLTNTQSVQVSPDFQDAWAEARMNDFASRLSTQKPEDVARMHQRIAEQEEEAKKAEEARQAEEAKKAEEVKKAEEAKKKSEERKNTPASVAKQPGGSVVLSNGNTAGSVGSAAAAEMARRTGVPASTWETIIARESNGQPSAYNPSGASGLFQTMPGWGSTATVEDQINAAERAYNAQGLSAWGF